MSDASSDSDRDGCQPYRDSREVFDLESSLVRLGGSREIFEMLIVFYRDDAQRLLQELREGEANRDLQQVHRAAHTLKGLAANFDASDAVAIALRLEKVAANGQFDAVRTLLPEIEREFQRLRQALDDLDAPSC